MYVILGMAFLAVLVGLSVHISHAQKKNSQSTSTARTNNAPTTTTQDQQPIGPSVRLTQTNDFLTRYSISHGDNLKDLTTPQYLAAVWIADHDVLTYKIPDSPTDDAYMNFVQRYVLAVFYFSTGGHGWKNQDLFLDKAHECAWYTPDHLVDGEVVALGVTCDNEGQVSALLMRKYSLLSILYCGILQQKPGISHTLYNYSSKFIEWQSTYRTRTLAQAVFCRLESKCHCR